MAYPFYHSYDKPTDYILCKSAGRRNFIFDGDTVSGAVRILLGYNNGPILETFGKRDGNFKDTAPLIGPLNFAQGNGTWQYQVDPWAITNLQAAPTAISGSNNTYTVIYNAPWVAGVRQSVASTDTDLSCVIKAGSGRAGIMMRSNGAAAANVYYLDIAAGVVKVGVNVAGTGQGTTVFTGTTPIVANTNYTLRLVNVGNSYTAYLNGNVEGTFTSSVNNGAWLGIWADDISARFTTFSQAKLANPAPNAGGTLAWALRNYDGDLVVTGTISNDYIDIPDSFLTWRGHGPYGWYRLYITGPDHGDGQWGTAYGDCTFYRVRTDSMFAANAPAELEPADAIYLDEYARATMGGLGVMRFPISSSTSGTPAANNANTAASSAVLKTSWVDLALSSRPRLNLGAFSSGTVGVETSVITPTVALLKNSIQAWEPRNEPNYGAFGEGYITNEFDPFRTAVKAGDATAKVIGPGPVTYNNQDSGGILSFIDTFLVGVMSRGGTAYLDGLSVHSYNCSNGDLALTRKCLVGLKAIITARGYTGPIYQTEQGFDWEHFALVQPRHGGQWTALHAFVLELYGIPHENNSYWYDFSHGFNDVPVWWLDGPGYYGPGPGPQVLPLRTMAAEIGNRTLTAQFAFDSFSQYLYAGGTWTGGDGSKTVGFIGATVGLRDLPLNVSGTSTLTCVDAWGNTFTLPVTAGQATLPVGEMPVWVRCPVGVTVTPATIGFTSNLAATAAASATGDQTFLTRVNDGEMQNQYYTDSAAWTDAYAPYSDRTNTFPQTITLTWPAPVTANRIIVHSMMPWQELGTLTDFDVDTWDGTTWTTRYHQSLPASKTFLFTSVGKCLVESYWDARCAWDISFTTAAFSAVRVVVRACSYGEFETSYMRNTVFEDPTHLTQYLAIRDIQVFNAASVSLAPRIRNPAMGGVTG